MADPKYELLSSSRFYLEISLKGSDELIDGYFMECQGFKRTQEAIEICESTPQKWGNAKSQASKGRVVRTKLPGNFKCDNIILKQGITISPTMWKWFKAVEEGDWAKQRRDGDLSIYTQGAKVAARFRFLGAWPVSYKVGDVKAGNNDFEVQEVELAVDQFIRVDPNGSEYSVS
ncbi:MAG: phage tail protein [Cyanobacteria bacterium J06638_28]